MVDYADCLYSLIQKGYMLVSVYSLNYKSSVLLCELRTEHFANLKSGVYGLSQKKMVFQRGSLIESRLVL